MTERVTIKNDVIVLNTSAFSDIDVVFTEQKNSYKVDVLNVNFYHLTNDGKTYLIDKDKLDDVADKYAKNGATSQQFIYKR